MKKREAIEYLESIVCAWKCSADKYAFLQISESDVEALQYAVDYLKEIDNDD